VRTPLTACEEGHPAPKHLTSASARVNNEKFSYIFVYAAVMSHTESFNCVFLTFFLSGCFSPSVPKDPFGTAGETTPGCMQHTMHQLHATTTITTKVIVVNQCKKDTVE